MCKKALISAIVYNGYVYIIQLQKLIKIIFMYFLYNNSTVLCLFQAHLKSDRFGGAVILKFSKLKIFTSIKSSQNYTLRAFGGGFKCRFTLNINN